MSDDAVRDTGDDTVLYIIPGDSAAPYSRLWIEESNYGRSVTPQCYYQVDMSTAGLGEGWAATHMAAIKAVCMRDADAEIYWYIYIKKKKDRVHWESSVFTLCADGYLDIEADVAFAASTNLMQRGKDILFLGKFWGRSTGIPRLSTTIAGTHRSSSSRQEQKAAPPCWLSTVQFQSRQKWKKQSVCVRLSLRVRIVCSLFVRVLGPVEKKIRWWFYRVPQCGGV